MKGFVKKIKDSRASRYVPVVLALVAVLISTTIASIAVYRWERERFEKEFLHLTDISSLALSDGIKNHVEVLELTRNFYYGSEFVSREEFAEFTGNTVRNHEGLRAIEWIPRIPEEGESEYRDAALADGITDFVFTSWNDGW